MTDVVHGRRYGLLLAQGVAGPGRVTCWCFGCGGRVVVDAGRLAIGWCRGCEWDAGLRTSWTRVRELLQEDAMQVNEMSVEDVVDELYEIHGDKRGVQGAIAEAGAAALHFSVCHQCGSDLDVTGDLNILRVLDDDGEEVYADDPLEEARRERDKARAEVERLRNELVVVGGACERRGAEVERLRAVAEAARRHLDEIHGLPMTHSMRRIAVAIAALDAGERS